MSEPSRKDLRTVAEVSERLRTSPNTLSYWRQTGDGPPWAKIGRRVFYDAAGLEQWVADRFEEQGRDCET